MQLEPDDVTSVPSPRNIMFHEHVPESFARMSLLKGRTLGIELLSSSCRGGNHHLLISRFTHGQGTKTTDDYTLKLIMGLLSMMDPLLTPNCALANCLHVIAMVPACIQLVMQGKNKQTNKLCVRLPLTTA